MVELANKHSVEEIAESLYNACARAAYQVEQREDSPPPFGHLSLEDQQGFYVLAREGASVLQQLEHQPLREVARQLYTEAGPGKFGGEAFNDLPAVSRLMFEMAARQLAILIDCDEAATLAEVEQFVLEWFGKKLRLAMR